MFDEQVKMWVFEEEVCYTHSATVAIIEHRSQQLIVIVRGQEVDRDHQ